MLRIKLGHIGQRDSAAKIEGLSSDILSRIKYEIESRVEKTAIHMIVVC